MNILKYRDIKSYYIDAIYSYLNTINLFAKYIMLL